MGQMLYFPLAMYDKIKETAIPPKYKTEAEEFCKKLYGAYVGLRDGSFLDHERLLKGWRDYCNVLDETGGWDWDHHVADPAIHTDIRIWTARAIEAFMNTPELARISPYGYALTGDEPYEIMEAKARLLQKVSAVSFKMANFEVTAMRAFLDAGWAGRVITKQVFTSMERPDGNGGAEITREYSDCKNVDPFNFFMDRMAIDVQRARVTFERITTSEEDLQAGVEKGFYTAGAEKLVQWVDGYDETFKSERDIDSRTPECTDNPGYCKIIEAWAFWDPDGNKKRTLWRFFFDENTGKLLGARENPFGHGMRPYALGCIIPRPYQAYGISLPELLHGLAVAGNTFLNQMLDNLAASGNIRHGIIDNDVVDELEFRRSVPNQVIHFKDLAGYKSIQANPLPEDVWRIQDFLMGARQRSSGSSDMAMALRAPNTAFAANAIDRNAQINFDIFTTWLVKTWMVDAVTQMVLNIQDFQDLSLYIKEDDAVLKVDKHALSGIFNIECADMKVASRKAAMAEKIMPLIAQGIQGKVPGDYGGLFKEMYQLLGMPDWDRFFGQGMMVPGEGAQPQGIAGQPNPKGPGTPEVNPNAERLQIRPGMAGTPPEDVGAIPAWGGE